MIKTRLISSLEKPFVDMKIEDFAELGSICGLKGERLSFQLIHTRVAGAEWACRSVANVQVEGKLAEYVTVRNVASVAALFPIHPHNRDNDLLRDTPGLYPDLLEPLRKGGNAIVRENFLGALWFDIELPKDVDFHGESALTVKLVENGNVISENTLTVKVLNAILPEQTMYYTEWFHCDCLAQYYRVPMFSEEHWRIIENFARVAVKNGINMLLTPTFTPPLDTQVGGERLTTQLVGVTLEGGKYTFDFTLLDRWVAMCDRVGIKYFEIAHMFTQWGVAHAPKVMATVDGEYKRIFGWDTDATSEEYSTFLRTFLTEFLAHMKKNGNDKRCFFHISDEPNEQHIEAYKAAKAIVSDLLKDYVIMDALSRYEFYAEGILETPIPSNNHIEPFIENKVPNLWTYYCCSQCINVSNRLIAMSSWRNRSIGMQMYKYDIVGFLQWGYNFYNNIYSTDPINPYVISDGDAWVPAGDAFSVYPGLEGEALESMRIVVFAHALQDVSAMKLCESLYSKEEVVKAIEDVLGFNLTFSTCAPTAEKMQGVRDVINEMIERKL